jgi:NAD(P)-dependent dehydrogenase (short-subunit alcohol dehydrogenase family)
MKGETVVITGATSGIGEVAARRRNSYVGSSLPNVPALDLDAAAGMIEDMRQ